MWRAATSEPAMRQRIWAFVAALIAAVAVLLTAAAPASAGIHTWVGGGSNGSWSDSTKWAGGDIPENDDPRPIIVRFDVNTVSTMNISGLLVDAIQFQGSGNVINGTSSQTLGLSGALRTPNILSGAGANRIAATLPIALGVQMVTVYSASGTLTLEGAISGGPDTALKFAAGSATAGTTITGSVATGGTLVASGQLGLDSPSAVAVQCAFVQVGEGGGDGATLRAFRGEELAPTAEVTVKDDGTLNLGGSFVTIQRLSLDRGAVQANTRLSVSGDFSALGGSMSGTGVLSVDGNVTLGSAAADAPATISTTVNLEGEQTFTVNDGPAATDATLSGVIDDFVSPGALVKAGTGTLRLSPVSSNGYDDRTLVRDGTLELKAASGRAIPAKGSTLEIGDNVGAPSSASVVELTENDISSTTPVKVGTDGRLALNGFGNSVASLENLGVVDLPGDSFLSVLGDTSVSGRVTGTGRLRLGLGGPSTLTLPSTPVGPPRIEAEVQLFDATEIFVTAGITAELSGGFGPGSSGAPAVTKTGFGTLTLARKPASGTLGLTTVSQGTLVMNGLVSSPFAVAAGATLAGNGNVGALTVGGTVAPSTPGLTASNVTFQAGARLRSQIPASGAAPSLNVGGAVAIDPAAILELPLAPGAARATAPSQLGLLTKTAPGPISGRFTGVAEGGELVPGPGLSYTFGYGAGDGNDLVGQLRNAAPVAAITGFPSGRALTDAGQPLTFAAAATDADGDPLTFTWEFGDGGTATGASVSHTYGGEVAGERTAKVTVSDGRLSGTATIPVNVIPKAGPAQARPDVESPPAEPADTTAPLLTFTIAKGQKLSKKGTINAKLRCSEACTVTLATSIKPPGKKSKLSTGAAGVQLQAGVTITVPVAVPRPALPAVRSAIKRKLTSTLRVTATARDGAGNAAKPIKLSGVLRR